MCGERSKYRTLKGTSTIFDYGLLPANSIEKDIKWLKNVQNKKRIKMKNSRSYLPDRLPHWRKGIHTNIEYQFITPICMCVCFFLHSSQWKTSSENFIFWPFFSPLLLEEPIINSMPFVMLISCYTDVVFFYFILLVQSHTKASFFCCVSPFKLSIFKSFIKWAYC